MYPFIYQVMGHMAVPMVLKNTTVRVATHQAPLTGKQYFLFALCWSVLFFFCYLVYFQFFGSSWLCLFWFWFVWSGLLSLV